MFPLPIFPTNGFDTSILTPVLVGMGFLSLFAETLGWPFVGLVVPGYLAAVGIAAPLSAITIVVESFATFLLSRIVGIWIPETSSWTVFFGRERFFLLILSSVIVRLTSEGFVLPYLASEFGFAFASELYSIGLVLVPLVANAFWNIGLVRGVWQMGVVASCTFVVCKWVVLPLTNLSLSRFELTYESVALDFLASSKSYVILLAGTALAARSNVRFGWDFNGILVPGLLTVAWYSPVKLASTFVEAFIVAWLAKKLVATPLFQRALIEGPRRTVLVFIVGYVVKYLEGVVALFLMPGEEITDFYGFGYVLPSLLAVKVWGKGSPGKVLMPAFQVSLLGFFVGNAIGYLFTVAMPYTVEATNARAITVERAGPMAAEALLHIAGSDHEMEGPDTRAGRPVVMLAASARGRGRSADFALRAVEGEGLDVRSSPRTAGGDWWVVRRSVDGKRGAGIPLVALTRARAARGIVVVESLSDGSGIAHAVVLAEALGASAILAIPQGTDDGVESSWRSALEVATEHPVVATLRASESGAVRVEWGREAKKPAGVYRLFAGNPKDDTTVPRERAAALWEQAFPSPAEADPLTQWQMVQAFASAQAGAPAPVSTDERVVFRRVVVPAVLRWSRGDNVVPGDGVRVAARALGLSFGRISPSESQAPLSQETPPPDFPETAGDAGVSGAEPLASGAQSEGVLVLKAAEGRGRDFLWLAHRGQSGLVVSSPDVRVRGVWEAVRLAAVVSGADHVLVSRRSAATSFFESAHRALLDKSRHVLEVRPILQALRAIDAPVVLTTGDVVISGQGEPAWASSLAPLWLGFGVIPVWYDARPEFWSLRGTGDAVIGIGHAVGRREVVLAWFKPEFLSLLATPPDVDDEETLLAAAGWKTERMDLAVALSESELVPASPCDWEKLTGSLARFRHTKNPFALSTARKAGCAPRLVRDEATSRLYVVGRPGPNARASRFDGLGHSVEASSLAAASRAVLAGAGTVDWKVAP